MKTWPGTTSESAQSVKIMSSRFGLGQGVPHRHQRRPPRSLHPRKILLCFDPKTLPPGAIDCAGDCAKDRRLAVAGYRKQIVGLMRCAKVLAVPEQSPGRSKASNCSGAGGSVSPSSAIWSRVRAEQVAPAADRPPEPLRTFFVLGVSPAG